MRGIVLESKSDFGRVNKAMFTGKQNGASE